MKASPLAVFRDLRISTKLELGFGAFVLLALLAAAASFAGSTEATNKANLTSTVRMPVALTAAQAQTDLLRLTGDIRGYLALGDQEYWDSYGESENAFRADLAALEQLQPYFDPLNAYRFEQLKAEYEEWSALPSRLYSLRNDQLEREPAYRLLATDGVRSAGKVLIAVNALIDAPRTPGTESMAQIQEMADFQGTFAAMLSALRGYTTTRNRIFRQEYEVNLTANDISWDEVWSKRDELPADQQKLLDQAEENRAAFLALPDQIFPLLEGESWREDLYLFRTEGVPLTDRMQSLLADMTSDQQVRLTTELEEGRQALIISNRQIVAGGLAALVVGVLLAIITRANIATPIRRLTGVAEKIQSGDLNAQARVESRDEIGILARTFNSMTSQLKSTLTQVRKEKARADNLLNVVIPLGVQLSSEKDFNLLLERTVVEAEAFCRASGGLLYLRSDGDLLKPVIARYATQGVNPGGATVNPVERDAMLLAGAVDCRETRYIPAQAALTGRTLNLDLAKEEVMPEYELALEISESSERLLSVLAIPLKNNEGYVLGVLELLNAKDPESGAPVAFDANLQQMMESYSSLAVAALEAYIREQSLRQEIQQLRIEIDEAKRQQQVSEIVDTDFFQDLQVRARAMRGRRRQSLASE